MRKFYIFVFLVFSIVAAKAQTFQYDWSNTYGTNNYGQYITGSYRCGGTSSWPTYCNDYSYFPSTTQVTSSAYIPSGDVILGGTYNVPINLDPRAGTSMTPGMGYTSSYGGYANAFFGRYNSSGAMVWAKYIRSGTSLSIRHIGSDASGNIYTIGSFSSAIYPDPSSSTYINPAGGSDIYIFKYNSGGNLIWAKTIGGASSEILYSVTVDSSGNTYLAGLYYAGFDADAGSGIASLPQPADGQDLFLAKYDSDGNHVWSKGIVSNNSSVIRATTADAAGNFFIAGNFSGSLNAGSSESPADLTSSSNNGFIIKYTAAGAHSWSKKIQSASNSSVMEIHADASGNLIAAGQLTNETDIDPSNPDNPVLTSEVQNTPSSWLAKYQSSGELLWGKSFQGGIIGFVNLKSDEKGNIFFSSYFGTPSIDADPDEGTAVFTTAGSTDILFGVYDKNGKYIKAERIGSGGDEIPSTMSLTGSKMFLGGYVRGSFDLDPGEGTALSTYYSSNYNGFAAEYAISLPPGIDSFSPLSAPAGTTVTIKGSGFTGATAVSFGGTSAVSFTVISDMEIEAVVGAGTSGDISVTTAKGSGAISDFVFVAGPIVATGGASSISSSSAALNATVDDNGKDTEVSFEYGLEADLSDATVLAATTGGTITGGSGSTSAAVTLSELDSSKTYYFRVKAENADGISSGLIKNFKTLSSNAALSSLTISEGLLSPEFTTGETAYAVTVSNSVNSVTVSPTLAESTASVKIGTGTVTSGNASGSIALSEGTNTINVVVTAEDPASSKTYTITVTRKKTQSITFAPTDTKTYGDDEYEPTGSSSSGLDLVYESSDPSVAKIQANGKVLILKAGETTIKAKQAGSDLYESAVTAEQVLTVKKKALTITAKDKSKIYGETVTFAGTEFVSEGLINNDAVSSVLLSSTGAAATAAVSSTAYDIEASSASGTGLSNYAISYAKGGLTVGKKALTITAKDKSKTYGETVTFAGTEFTSEGLVNTDAVSSVTLSSTGTAASAAVSSTTYDIEASSASGTGLGNYTISYVKGGLTVGKKALTITAKDKSKTYGETVTFAGTEFTTEGLVNTDAVSSVTLSSIGAASTAAVSSTAYDIEASSASGTGLGNYTISYAKGGLTVGKKALTITAKDKSKTYGETVTFAGTEFTTEGLVNTDAVSSVSLSSTGAEASAAVSSTAYDIEASSASGTGLGNYTISYAKGGLSIGKKALTITAKDKSKTYGETVSFAGTEFTTEGLVNTDAVSSITLSSTGAAASAAVSSTAYDIEASAASGTGLGNYTISYAKGGLTVGKKALTITAKDKSKTYGETVTFAGTEFTTEGLINTDAVSSITLSSTGAISTAAVSSTAYDIEASSASGTGLGNYTISYAKGGLTVGKKALTITAKDKSKTYGETVTFAGTEFTTEGLVNTDAVSSVTLSSTGAAATAGVSSTAYDIEASSASGTGLANYTISYAKGGLTVGKKALTITAKDKSKTYGETVTFAGTEFTTEGLINNDAVSSVTLSSTGAASTAAVSSTAYDIEVSSASGTGLGNYTISYAKGGLTVGKKALTITAKDKSKTYGETVSFAGTEFTTEGLVNTDAVSSVTLSSTGAGSTAAVSSTAYDIVASSANGTGLGNYTISYAKGGLTVGKKALTITVENKNKTYGDPNPELTVVYAGLVNNETLLTPAPAVVTNALKLSAAGTYDITASGTSENYTITFVKGTLTIAKKLLTVKADDKEKYQGTANPALTVSYSGFVTGESKADLLTEATASTAVVLNTPKGSYDIIASGASSNNYSFDYVKGVFEVKPGHPTSISLAASTVYENQAAGTLAGTLSSTSDDPSATFTYTLVDGFGDKDLFEIVGQGTRLTTKESLNFENKSSYRIKVRSTTQHGLWLEKEFTINIVNVNEQPTLANIAPETICYTTAPQLVGISGISAGPDANQSTNVSVSSSNNSLFEVLEVNQAVNGQAELRYVVNKGASGSAVVNVLVTDDGGTANGGVNSILKSFTITVNPLPVVTISSDKGNSISKGDELNLTATGGVSYQWSNAEGIISGQNTATLRVRPSVTTTYRVTATNATNCSEVQEFTVTVNEDYQMVNATNLVTPNGDNVNDYFVIRNLDMYPNHEVKIFDRAGRLLYSKKNYDDSWNGTFNGAPLAEDTYYYIVDFGSKKPVLKGFITIVRE